MKTLWKAGALLTLLGAFLFYVSCGGSATNSNSNIAATATKTPVNGVDIPLGSDECSESNPSIRKGKIENGINRELNRGGSHLHSVWDRKVFKYEARIQDQSIYLYIWGVVDGEEAPGELSMLLKKAVYRDCVKRVIFHAPSDYTLTTVDDGNFYWTSCAPDQTCPGGICAPTCPDGNGNANHMPHSNTSNMNKANANQ